MTQRFPFTLMLVVLPVLIGTAVAVSAPGRVIVGAASYTPLSGTILVDPGGRPLYHLISEKGKSIRCTGGCAKTWPPVLLPKGSTAGAGPGVTRTKLGTIKRPDGRLQATYAGFPLYRYASDRRGTAGGQGLGKVWYVVNSAGRIITRAVVDTPMEGGTSGGDTGGGETGGDDGGGYGY